MVAADVRSLLPANLNEVGNKCLFGAFFELIKVSKSKNLAILLTKKLDLKKWRAFFILNHKINNIVF